MKRAWEIRKEAAKKWNCKVSEIVFPICLKMAWAEKMENTKMESHRTKEIKRQYEENGKIEKLQKRMEKFYTRRGNMKKFSCQAIKDELFKNTDEKFWERRLKENPSLNGLIKNRLYEIM